MSVLQVTLQTTSKDCEKNKINIDNSQLFKRFKRCDTIVLDYCLFIENSWLVCENVIDMLQKSVKLNQYMIIKSVGRESNEGSSILFNYDAY